MGWTADNREGAANSPKTPRSIWAPTPQERGLALPIQLYRIHLGDKSATGTMRELSGTLRLSLHEDAMRERCLGRRVVKNMQNSNTARKERWKGSCMLFWMFPKLDFIYFNAEFSIHLNIHTNLMFVNSSLLVLWYSTLSSTQKNHLNWFKNALNYMSYIWIYEWRIALYHRAYPTRIPLKTQILTEKLEYATHSICNWLEARGSF